MNHRPIAISKTSNKSIQLFATPIRSLKPLHIARTIPKNLKVKKKKKLHSRNLTKALTRTPIRIDLSSQRNSSLLVGLLNIGNTCFLNSIVQCLVHLPQMKEFFSDAALLSGELKGTKDSSLSLALYKLISSMNLLKSYSSIAPVELKQLMGKKFTQFSGCKQHDAAEFMRCMIDSLHRDLNRVQGTVPYKELSGDSTIRKVADDWWEYSLSRENSKITDIFQGQLVYQLSCSKCAHSSFSCESFLDLTIPAVEGELSDCFSVFTRESELLSYTCQKCKSFGNCQQRIGVYRNPKVLVIQLKRFSQKEKLCFDIKIPELLELSQFCWGKTKDTKYQLVASVHHTGDLKFGHYKAECLVNSNWYCFNDSNVIQTSRPGFSDSAYILFYSNVCHN